ncbi:hypothetical protein [Actinoplanes siamensis]|uniref:Uncharacterized protein n=1 Tax=Actinoplanes siamensis TaxID=1223317 RepID=A0A919N3V0_9ACTN|nr:hypothetical protein [Actinoplanes siamensis]GIF03885.1 hypothetical protein Asi03nite_14230 [Actinoplanes siamensis]
MNDRRRWTRYLDARAEMLAARDEFHRHPAARREILAGALDQARDADPSEVGAALEFLREHPEDVPDLLPLLVDRAMSLRFAGRARKAVAAGRRDQVTVRLRRIVADRLADPACGASECRRLAELLDHLGDHSSRAMLARLTSWAGDSGDPDLRRVAADYAT